MALRQVRIGNLTNVHQYDDAVHAAAADFDGEPIEVGASAAGTQAVRQDQLPTLGNIISSSAVITDHAVVRGDGGARGIQDSGVIITDLDNMNVPGMVRQGAIWHAYGGFEDQAETITCGVGDWNHITNAGNNLWNLDEADGITIAADVLTLTNTGDYHGVLSLSISALTGKDFHVRVYNNTQVRVEGRPIGVSTTGAGNEMNVCVPIYIEGTAGDDIQFEIMSADGTDPDVDDGIFIITYLHD